MATVQDARDATSAESTGPTHPFFQSCPIPHRTLTLNETGRETDLSSPPTRRDSSSLRKRKLGPSARAQSPINIQRLPVDGPLQQTMLEPCSGGEQTMETTPKTKVLKLNANGKLLSSPPAAPAHAPCDEQGSATRARRKRVKTQFPNSRSSRLIAKIAYGHDNLERQSRIGKAINALLDLSKRTTPSSKSPSTTPKKKTPQRSTHPFFLDRGKGLGGATEIIAHGDGQSADDPETPSTGGKGGIEKKSPPAKAPAWKDMVSSSRQSDVHRSQALPAPWPPADMQRVDDLKKGASLNNRTIRPSLRTCKSKELARKIPEDEDMLVLATRRYFEHLDTAGRIAPRLPARRVLAGEDMSDELDRKLSAGQIHLATQRLKASLASSLTAFDQGRCDQSSWTTKSAPCTAEEVLQPSSEAVVLRDWVKNLTVTAVEGVQPAGKVKPTKPRGRKRGRPKLPDDDDGFLVSGEDEADELAEVDELPQENSPFINETKRTVISTGAMNSGYDRGQMKNAIVISGPAGCGKTASVYAVAKELGFEVFEIHPGTRRGARDILEKVGDMTQNHLVQQHSQDGSGPEGPEISIDDGAIQEEIASGKQRTMRGFFPAQITKPARVEKKRKAVRQDEKEKEVVKKPRKAQKQSLILLEEVDILFDEDKFFWSGVMSLIEQSRRPIILTCNDEASLPLDELPLHGILRYSSVPEQVATDYLLALAANQGHDLQRDAMASLYRSKDCDLRAAISELNFWCQMGVGSRKGGLDWMLNMGHSTNGQARGLKREKVFSTDTYVKGMDLAPDGSITYPDQLLYHAHQQLDLTMDTWLPETESTFPDGAATIKDVSALADSYSDLDLCYCTFTRSKSVDEDRENEQSDLHLHISISLVTHLLPVPNRPSQSTILSTHNSKKTQPDQSSSPINLTTLAGILSPLQAAKPTFPTSQMPGRQSPSLDSPRSDVMIGDIAPYVRSIVAFEERWGAAAVAAAGGSGAVRRTTRASANSSGRAGGYLPRQLDKRYVLMTGGEGWADLSLTSGSERSRDGALGSGRDEGGQQGQGGEKALDRWTDEQMNR